MKTIVNDIFGSGNCDGLIDSKDVVIIWKLLKQSGTLSVPYFMSGFVKMRLKSFAPDQ